MIINIRGTSGSGKSTLVKRFLDEHQHETIEAQLGPWKKERVIAYKCWSNLGITNQTGTELTTMPISPFTFVIGRYDTQCGGCDSMSYKGSHPDIEDLVRQAAEKGNVIFEGLTVSSTFTRWLGISQDFPGRFIWCFMDTPVDVCYQRILTRSGGREPKRDERGLADYQRKHRSCQFQMNRALEAKERVVELSSDDNGYQTLLALLGEKVATAQP